MYVCKHHDKPSAISGFRVPHFRTHIQHIYIYIIALIVHDIITNYVTPKLLEHLEWDDGQTSRNPIFNGEKYGFNMLKNRIQSIHPSPSGVRRHVRPGEPAELSWSFFGNKPASSPKEATEGINCPKTGHRTEWLFDANLHIIIYV